MINAFASMRGCLGILLFLPISCATFPAREVEAAVYDCDAMPLLKENSIIMGTTEIIYADESSEFAYPLAHIIKPLAARFGFSTVCGEDRETGRDKAVFLDIWLKEETFSKGLEFRTSIAGIFRIREEVSDRLIFSMSYVEESSETLRSFRTLYRIFLLLFQGIDYECKNKPANPS